MYGQLHGTEKHCVSINDRMSLITANNVEDSFIQFYLQMEKHLRQPPGQLSLSIGYRHSEDSKTPISPTISLLLQTDSPSHYWLKWHLSAFSNKALLQSIDSPWQQNMMKIQGYEHGLYHACITFQTQHAKMPVR